jgi:hypothetical protein
MPSTIRGSDNFDSTYGAALKAWVNFNGTGTPSIRASLNVTSLTDNGAGDYTVNFTNALADTNYGMVGGVVAVTGTNAQNVVNWHGVQATGATTKTTTAARIITALASTGAPSDHADVTVLFFR